MKYKPFTFPLALILSLSPQAASLPRLKVSDNHRFLVTEDGKPFFWLGDTTWELFHRLNRDEAVQRLDNRAERRFNVFQSVAIAEFESHSNPQRLWRPALLVDLDVTRPALKEGPQNDYWDHVDFIVKEANQRGMYLGFLPTWGRFWHDTNGGRKPLFTAANAEVYGEWLGRRYRNAGLVWILGGDRSVDTDDQKEITRAMARGLRRGDGGAHLMTFHPPGGNGSSTWFHNDEWLDFNMRQNGHTAEFTGRYDLTRQDYDRSPIKPVLDGEPIYEDHPVNFNARQFGHSIASDVRRPLYWDVFSGALGQTCGHHSVWQMWSPGKPPIHNPLLAWADALNQPGAAQIQHARALMESRLVILHFIATLGTPHLGRGFGLWLTQTRAMNLPDSFLTLGTTTLVGVPLPLVIAALVVTVAHLTLTRTPFGRQIHAVVNNVEGARRAGLHTGRLLAAVYVLSGLCAAMGGILSLAQLGAVSPTFGTNREFTAIAAAVLGGTSLFGGRGGVFSGTILGAVLIQSVKNGLVILNADPYPYPLITSEIIFLAVLLDSTRSRWVAHRNRRRVFTGTSA